MRQGGAVAPGRKIGLCPVYGRPYLGLEQPRALLAVGLVPIGAIVTLDGIGEVAPLLRGPAFTHQLVNRRLHRRSTFGPVFVSKRERNAHRRRVRHQPIDGMILVGHPNLASRGLPGLGQRQVLVNRLGAYLRQAIGGFRVGAVLPEGLDVALRCLGVLPLGLEFGALLEAFSGTRAGSKESRDGEHDNLSHGRSVHGAPPLRSLRDSATAANCKAEDPRGDTIGRTGNGRQISDRRGQVGYCPRPRPTLRWLNRWLNAMVR
ncbi:MAG: hypothetical protein E4H37_00895 [Gemmatimonadales bacterium]|nr:MAG: hypothetical protein E4H37_00895 [Gemmatimonadales bacterium]